MAMATKDAYSIHEFCERVGIGRSLTYLLIKAGKLRVVKLGRRTLVPAAEVQAFLERMRTEAAGGRPHA